MTVKLTWLGHAALALEIGDTKVLVDPFLAGNPLAAVDPDKVEADVILLTHGHGDHVGDTIAIARRTGAMVIANNEIARWCSKMGVETTHGMNPDGAYDFGFARIALTIAFHSSSLPDGSYGGQPNGILITTPDGTKLYLAGDTALFSDMKLIGAKGIDFAVLPIGGYFTMGPDEALEAVKLVEPVAVLPVHYNTFPVIQADVAAWAQRVHNTTRSKVIVLDPGGSYTI
ncbi:MAG: metal-dependent hydrolase [Anaerolineae bacterium]|nr:metal-dependent hydrolase [Anaerolineae bacterium]